MTIRDALQSFFEKQKALYIDTFGTLPSICWSPEINQNLFCSPPGDDGYAQWKPIPAQPVTVAGLGEDLREFFGAFYFGALSGRFDSMNLYFPPIYSPEDAVKKARNAIKDGDYYFPQKGMVLLASAEKEGNDDLLLFYNQNVQKLVVLDCDKNSVTSLNVSLYQLINAMEAII